MTETLATVGQVRERVLKHSQVEQVHWFLGESAPTFYYNVIPRRKGTPRYAQALVQLKSAEGARELIRELGKDRTVILSSHILPEVAEICRRVMIINNGRIVADGDATLTPVFDSGDTPLSLAAGADLMIVAIDNTGPGTSPVDLVVLDGTSASTIEDAATPASAIAVHLSPDAPAVDILADVNGTTEDEAIPLVRNVSFGGFCDLNAVPAPGDYTISVVANADNSVVAAQFPLIVDPSTEVTAIVSGFLTMGMTPSIVALPQVDDRRSVATETKLRVTHGSPSTGDVDIYLVPANTVIDDTVDLVLGCTVWCRHRYSFHRSGHLRRGRNRRRLQDSGDRVAGSGFPGRRGTQRDCT